MVENIITVSASEGLHARPAKELVELSRQFQSKCTLTLGAKTASSTSIISILPLGIKKGSELLIKTEGPDEQACMDAVSAFLRTI